MKRLIEKVPMCLRFWSPQSGLLGGLIVCALWAFVLYVARPIFS